MNKRIREEYKKTFSFINEFIEIGTKLLDAIDIVSNYDRRLLQTSLLQELNKSLRNATNTINSNIFNHILDNETSIALHMDYFVYRFLLYGLKVRMDEKIKSCYKELDIIIIDTLNSMVTRYVTMIDNKDNMLYIML